MQKMHSSAGEIPDHPLLRYPVDPGHRGDISSIEAAQKIKPSSKVLRRVILEALSHKLIFGATAHQLADYLHEPYENLQPRLSELQVSGHIKKSEHRRGKTPTGNSCAVWVVTEYDV